MLTRPPCQPARRTHDDIEGFLTWTTCRSRHNLDQQSHIFWITRREGVEIYIRAVESVNRCSHQVSLEATSFAVIHLTSTFIFVTAVVFEHHPTIERGARIGASTVVCAQPRPPTGTRICSYHIARRTSFPGIRITCVTVAPFDPSGMDPASLIGNVGCMSNVPTCARRLSPTPHSLHRHLAPGPSAPAAAYPPTHHHGRPPTTTRRTGPCPQDHHRHR
jgi:hypothetical protein